MTRQQMETAQQTTGFLYAIQWRTDSFVVSMTMRHSDGRVMLVQYDNFADFVTSFGGGL